MRRRTLLISLAAAGGLAGCDLLGDGRLEIITDPDLEPRVKAAAAAYAAGRKGLQWSVRAADAVGLLNLAEAPGARVLISRQTKLADNLQRTLRASLENRWRLGSVEDPVVVLVTSGQGKGGAKRFALWLTGPDAPAIVTPAPEPAAPATAP